MTNKEHDRRHGGPFDRGSADYYYDRPFRPHYFTGATYDTPEVTDLTSAERDAYKAGWEDAAKYGNKKDWG